MNSKTQDMIEVTQRIYEKIQETENKDKKIQFYEIYVRNLGLLYEELMQKQIKVLEKTQDIAVKKHEELKKNEAVSENLLDKVLQSTDIIYQAFLEQEEVLNFLMTMAEENPEELVRHLKDRSFKQQRNERKQQFKRLYNN